MAELDVLDVVGNGIEARCLRHHLLRRHKYELGVLIDELLDEPRAGDAIYLDLFAGDPFHAESPLQCLCSRRYQVSERARIPPCAGEITYSRSGGTITVVCASAPVMVRMVWPFLGSIVSTNPGSPIATWTRPVAGLKNVTSGGPAIDHTLVTSPEWLSTSTSAPSSQAA